MLAARKFSIGLLRDGDFLTPKDLKARTEDKNLPIFSFPSALHFKFLPARFPPRALQSACSKFYQLVPAWVV